MVCLNCNLSYDGNANFCQNCGNDLSKFESFLDNKHSQFRDDKLLLLLIGFEFIISIIWFIFSKLISIFHSDFQDGYLYISWSISFITLGTFLFVTIKVKNNDTRKFLIVFLVFKSLFVLYYQVYKFFK